MKTELYHRDICIYHFWLDRRHEQVDVAGCCCCCCWWDWAGGRHVIPWRRDGQQHQQSALAACHSVHHLAPTPTPPVVHIALGLHRQDDNDDGKYGTISPQWISFSPPDVLKTAQRAICSAAVSPSLVCPGCAAEGGLMFCPCFLFICFFLHFNDFCQTSYLNIYPTDRRQFSGLIELRKTNFRLII